MPRKPMSAADKAKLERHARVSLEVARIAFTDAFEANEQQNTTVSEHRAEEWARAYNRALDALAAVQAIQIGETN